jgi:hypothetical protein
MKWKHGDAEELRDLDRLKQNQALLICKRMKHRGWAKRFSFNIWRKLHIPEEAWRQMVDDFVEQELFMPWLEISCIKCSASVAQISGGKAPPNRLECEFCGTSFDLEEADHRLEKWYCFTDKLIEMMAEVR